MARRFTRALKKYGRPFYTKRGKYGRYVYRFGRRVAFEEIAKFARRKARKKWK